MRKYLTVKDYLLVVLLFIPMLFLVHFLLITLSNSEVPVPFSIFFTFVLLYFRLLITASSRRKRNLMIWYAEEEFKGEQESLKEKDIEKFEWIIFSTKILFKM